MQITHKHRIIFRVRDRVNSQCWLFSLNKPSRTRAIRSLLFLSAKVDQMIFQMFPLFPQRKPTTTLSGSKTTGLWRTLHLFPKLSSWWSWGISAFCGSILFNFLYSAILSLSSEESQARWSLFSQNLGKDSNLFGVSSWSDFTITVVLSGFLHFLAIELAEESAICHGI